MYFPACPTSLTSTPAIKTFQKVAYFKLVQWKNDVEDISANLKKTNSMHAFKGIKELTDLHTCLL